MRAPRRRANSSSSRITMPAPSPITNPSRSKSNGRDAWTGSSFLVESARKAANPATLIGVMADSAPPQIIASASPRWIILKLSPIACAPAEQAVAVFQKLLVFALDGPEIAYAAADVGADAFRDVVANLQSTIVDGLLRGSDGVMDERAHLARFFLLDIVQRIEILYFAREAGRKSGGVELLNVVGTASPFQ